MKLRIVKDRCPEVMFPWYVQASNGVTLFSFPTWEIAWATAVSLLAIRNTPSGMRTYFGARRVPPEMFETYCAGATA